MWYKLFWFQIKHAWENLVYTSLDILHIFRHDLQYAITNVFATYLLSNMSATL